MTTIEQMRALRVKLPKGKKNEWTKGSTTKKVMLWRALKKETLKQLTAGEYAAVQEWLEYVQQSIRAQENANNELTSLIEQTSKRMNSLTE